MSNNKRLIEQAELYAYWSFIGIIIPVVGIILAFISASKLKDVNESKLNEKGRQKVEDVLSMTHISRGAAVIVIMLGIVGYAYITQQQEAQYKDAQLRYYQEVQSLIQ